jgi:pyruvate dehydrogenase E2 component (dihydrolipoamide acetyltransferase)
MSDRTFLLPDLGEGLTEAEIVRWLVAEGDDVTVDQAMVEVETAKSVVEVPSPYAGRVLTQHASEGETLEVGKPLVTVGSGADSAASQPTPTTTEGDDTPGREAAAYREEEKAGSGNVLIGYGTSAETAHGRRRRRRTVADVTSESTAAPAQRAVPKVSSPIVRKLAADHGLDLRSLTGTGRDGLITRADVDRAIDTSSTTPSDAPAKTGGETRIPLTGFRKAVATTLSRSRSEIPEATVWVDVDATPLWELREQTRNAATPGPGLLAYLARFTVAALRQHPVLNSRIDTERDEIVQLDQVNLGLAVQGERGLVVPAVMGAERLTTSELDTEIRRVTASARAGRSTQEELTAGTFTLNNYGSFRVDGSAAIINHPQVAILGFGRMIERPWVVDGAIVPRRITQMSFVFDHRVCDGGTAAGFMRSVADAIENPAGAIAGL